VAFGGCTSLTSVTTPDSVTSIGDEAFFRCKNLTTVTLGNGVTDIGSQAFDYCGNLTSVTFRSMITSKKNINGFKSLKYSKDLQDKYFEGGIGTYTSSDGGNTWTKK